MYEPDRSELSQARLAMMARRRRALGVLTIGLAVAALVGSLSGSVLAWLVTALFALGLALYLVSLQSQAQHDRARREQRLHRAPVASARDYEATAAPERFSARPEAVVPIDADDVALDHFDTIDLTGLYTDEDMRGHDLRRAS